MSSPSEMDLRRNELTAAEQRKDIQMCIDICQQALAEDLRSDPKNLWFFGIKLVAYLTVEQPPARDEDVDEAIRIMRLMLDGFTREREPGYWARVHLQLGGAIARRGDDPQEALMHYEKALEVFTKAKQPEEWALAKKAAAELYYRMADSIDGLSKSLEYFRDALSVFTFEKYPDEGLVETIQTIEKAITKAKAQ